jgi:hypothetical protein
MNHRLGKFNIRYARIRSAGLDFPASADAHYRNVSAAALYANSLDRYSNIEFDLWNLRRRHHWQGDPIGWLPG